MFLAILSSSYNEEELENNTGRVVLKIPPFLAPYKLAVLPLVKKDGLSEFAKKLFSELKLQYNVTYDEKDAIGRRYRRQDSIGTPICITVDHETLIDGSVTLRNRDTMLQNRVKIEDLNKNIDPFVNMAAFLE